MIRLTVQRQAILDLINRSNQHWDAEELARCLGENGEQLGIAKGTMITLFVASAVILKSFVIVKLRCGSRRLYKITPFI